jgi:hypothetical protein
MQRRRVLLPLFFHRRSSRVVRGWLDAPVGVAAHHHDFSGIGVGPHGVVNLDAAGVVESAMTVRVGGSDHDCPSEYHEWSKITTTAPSRAAKITNARALNVQ